MTENIFSRVIAINHKISFFQNRELIRFYRAQLWNRDIMANLKMYNSEMAHFARVKAVVREVCVINAKLHFLYSQLLS